MSKYQITSADSGYEVGMVVELKCDERINFILDNEYGFLVTETPEPVTEEPSATAAPPVTEEDEKPKVNRRPKRYSSKK